MQDDRLTALEREVTAHAHRLDAAEARLAVIAEEANRLRAVEVQVAGLSARVTLVGALLALLTSAGLAAIFRRLLEMGA